VPLPPVLSNTSPIIKFVGVGLLDLLPRLYHTIWIADTVQVEYATKAAATDPDLTTLPWLMVQPVTIDPTLAAIPRLGSGEAATITLAQTSQARLVILDDRRARRIAGERGLAVVGTLGILLAAKQTRLIPAVRPVIDTMISQGRHISDTLRAQVLQAAGEEPA